MVVARPIEPTSIDFETYRCSAPIVPTKILTDSEELDRHLLQNGYSTYFNIKKESSTIEESCEIDAGIICDAIKSTIDVIENGFEINENFGVGTKVKSADICDTVHFKNNNNIEYR